jgi:hypothetical protein
MLCPSYKIAEAVESFLSNKPIRQSNKQFMVKGIIIKNTLQFIRNKYSQELYDKVTGALSGETKGLIESGVRQYNYYSSDIYYELNRSIEKYIKPQFPTVLEEVGEENARECIDAYKTALSLVSVSDFANFLQGLYKIVFPGISYEDLEINPDTKAVSYCFRSPGYTEDNIRLSAIILRGWITHFGKLLKINLSSFSSEVQKDNKGPKILCQFTWR